MEEQPASKPQGMLLIQDNVKEQRYQREIEHENQQLFNSESSSFRCSIKQVIIKGLCKAYIKIKKPIISWNYVPKHQPQILYIL